MPRVAEQTAGALGIIGRTRTARLRRLGLLFLVALGVVIAIGIVKPNPLASPQRVTAVFDESASLGKILRTVRVGGVNVGTIGEIRRVGDDAEIELVLHEDAGTIHQDARAEVRPHIFFEGTVFVELYPGSEDSPPLGDATIPKSQTDVFIPFDVAFRGLDDRTRESLRGMADELAPGLGGEAVGGVQRTLRGAPDLLEDLGPAARAAQGPDRTELNRAIEGMAGTLDDLATQEARIGPLVRDARRTFGAVGVDASRPLDLTLARLPSTLTELDRGSRALQAILDRLDPLAVELEPALVELTPTLREARPLLADARPVLERATPLLRDLRRALSATADAAPETRALLRALEPSLDILTDSAVPHLQEDTGLGIPNYLQLGGFLSGFNGVLRPYQTAAQQPLGAGHLSRIEGNFLFGTDPPVTPGCEDLGDLPPELVDALADAGLCLP